MRGCLAETARRRSGRKFNLVSSRISTDILFRVPHLLSLAPFADWFPRSNFYIGVGRDGISFDFNKINYKLLTETFGIVGRAQLLISDPRETNKTSVDLAYPRYPVDNETSVKQYFPNEIQR